MGQIQLKHGTQSAVPTSLLDGEFAINLDSRQLWFGSSSSPISELRLNKLIAETYEVSSSVTHMTTSFSSGSTEFGDSAGDSHTFTGTITASGIISASSFVTVPQYNIQFNGQSRQLFKEVSSAIQWGHQDITSYRIGKVGAEIYNDLTIHSDITASRNVSASGHITASGAFFNGNVQMGKLTATAGGSSLAGIVSVGTTDGDDRLHIARYRDTSTIYPFAHIYAGLSGLGEKCGFKIVVKNNSGTDGDGLKIDGNTKEATFYNVVNCTKLNTGQGDNELYSMNQDVETSDNVTFNAITATGEISSSSNIKGSYLYVDGVGIANMNGTDFQLAAGAGVGEIQIGKTNAGTPVIIDGAVTCSTDIKYGSAAVTQGAVKIVINTADANALHTTPITLVPAQGADTVIVPVSGMVRVDRAATQLNSAANMDFHYDGVTPNYFTTSLVHLRRFMYNETGDRVYAITQPGIEVGQSLTDDVNAALKVSISSALTTDCITSITIFLNYNVYDIS